MSIRCAARSARVGVHACSLKGLKNDTPRFPLRVVAAPPEGGFSSWGGPAIKNRACHAAGRAASGGGSAGVVARTLRQQKAADAMRGPAGPGVEFCGLFQRLRRMRRRADSQGLARSLAAEPAHEVLELMAHGVLLSRRAGTERTSSQHVRRQTLESLVTQVDFSVMHTYRKQPGIGRAGKRSAVWMGARGKERVGR